MFRTDIKEEQIHESIALETKGCNYCNVWAKFMHHSMSTMANDQNMSSHVPESHGIMAGIYVLQTKKSSIKDKECVSNLVKDWIEKMKRGELSVEQLGTSCESWIKLPNHYARLSELFEPISGDSIMEILKKKNHEHDEGEGDCPAHPTTCTPDDLEKERCDLNGLISEETESALRKELSFELDKAWSFVHDLLEQLKRVNNMRCELTDKSEQLESQRPLLKEDSKEQVIAFLKEQLVVHLNRIESYTDLVFDLNKHVYQMIQQQDNPAGRAITLEKEETDIDVLLLGLQNFIKELAKMQGITESGDHIYNSIFTSFKKIATDLLDFQHLLTNDIIHYLQILMVKGETAETHIVIRFDKQFSETHANLLQQRAELWEKYKQGASAGRRIMKKVLLKAVHSRKSSAESIALSQSQSDLIDLDTDSDNRSESTVILLARDNAPSSSASDILSRSDDIQQFGSKWSLLDMDHEEPSVTTNHEETPTAQSVVEENNDGISSPTQEAISEDDGGSFPASQNEDAHDDSSQDQKEGQEEEKEACIRPKTRWENISRENRNNYKTYEKQRYSNGEGDWEAEKPAILKGRGLIERFRAELRREGESNIVAVKKPMTPPGLMAHQMTFDNHCDQYREGLPKELETISSDLLATIVRHLHRENDTLVQLVLQLKEEMSMMTSQYVEVIRYNREKEVQHLSLFEKKREEELVKIKKYVYFLESQLKKREAQ